MYPIGYIWHRLCQKVQGKAIRSCSIEKTARVGAGTTMIFSYMGKNSYCGYNCMIAQCHIGSFCSISNNVIIGPAAHPMNWVSTSPAFLKDKAVIPQKYAQFMFSPCTSTNIGNDVWIGEGVHIKAGVCIGNGAIVGMGSVVTKDVPDYAIVAGNPAKIIRMRFEEEEIIKLLSIRWWEWEDSKLRDFAGTFDNIKLFLELHGGEKGEREFIKKDNK